MTFDVGYYVFDIIGIWMYPYVRYILEYTKEMDYYVEFIFSSINKYNSCNGKGKYIILERDN